MVSDKQLLEDLREFAEELGETPTYREMDNSGPWSASTYENHFGTWENALEKLNLDKNTVGVKPTSRAELIEDLKKFADKLDDTPTKSQMNNSGPWSQTVYQDRFGSWNEALRRAGLKINLQLNISNEELLRDLKEFSDKIDKTPSYNEMYKEGPYPPRTYERRFGSWNSALREAGLEINTIQLQKIDRKKSHPYGEGYIKARRKTLERDGDECKICGREDKLHCHHIKPRRKFDDVSESNTLDNLIILCPSCHGTYEGEWQDSTPDEFAAKAKR